MQKILIVALVLALSTQSVSAQTIEQTPSLSAPAPELSLVARKTKTETDLTTLEAQFRIFITRTQLTIDRLTAKGVDTASSQAQLTLALTSLNTAKANLELFSALTVTNDMNDAALEKAGYKTTLAKVQDSLKESRTHLIQSLTELKSSITGTTTQ